MRRVAPTAALFPALLVWMCAEAGAQQDPPPPKPKGRAWDDVSFYPIPAITSGKNEGTTYGFLGAFLLPNPQGDIDQLFSLQLAYRDVVGVSGFADYRNYLTDTALFNAFAYEAARVENDHQARYDDRDFLKQFNVLADFHESRVTTDRYFGDGRDTPRTDESVMTSNNYQLDLRFGPNLSDSLSLQATVRARRFRVGRSLVEDIPQTLDAYIDTLGIEGGKVLAHGLRLTYDTRDSINTPTRGEYGNVYFEIAHFFTEGRRLPFQTFGLEIAKLWPFDEDGGFVLVAHFKVKYVHDDAPFWELGSLGGGTTLRSFPGDRFHDDMVFLFNLEWRVRVVTMEIEGVEGEVQAAPFLDMGELYDTPDHLFSRSFREGFHYSYGLGLRGVVKPHIVGRLDLGYGTDGLAVTAGLDYPF